MNTILCSRPFLIQHCSFYFILFYFCFTGECLVEFTVPFFCGGGVNFTLSSGKSVESGKRIFLKVIFYTSRINTKKQFRHSIQCHLYNIVCIFCDRVQD